MDFFDKLKSTHIRRYFTAKLFHTPQAYFTNPQGFISLKKAVLVDCFFLVPLTGLEPVRCRQRGILSPLCLPFHHSGG